MSIDNTLMDSVLDDVYSCGGDSATFKGTSIECTIARFTSYEKSQGAANSDIVINVQISVIDALASSGIAKSDVIVFKGISYNNIVVFEKNEYEYVLGAYVVI